MKRITISYLIIICVIPSLWAGILDYNEYSSTLSDLDVRIEVPSGFHVMDMRDRENFYLYVNPEYKIDITYPFALESGEENVAILFPSIDIASGKQIIRRGNIIEDEIRGCYGDPEIDVTSLVSVTVNRDSFKYANADTIAVYKLESNTDRLFAGKYNHYLGVYFRKYGHPALLLKILMTDEGYQKKEDYLLMLYRIINYGVKPTEELLLQEMRLNYINDLKFPTKPYKPDGIIITPVERALLNIWGNGGKEAYDILNSNAN
ncbi:MAG: hypothetical protein J1F10_04890 [Muribaculaceae bacterium]|nr:hypothetical protein [Muribaculaceae bacterium]